MKNKIILIVIILLPLLFIKIPKYKELNNLIIIKKIDVTCTNNKYIIELEEIFPEKNDTSIKYKYKKYKEEGSNLDEIKKSIEDNSNKKFYYGKAKEIITNCNNKKEILNTFNLKRKRITNN